MSVEKPDTICEKKIFDENSNHSESDDSDKNDVEVFHDANESQLPISIPNILVQDKEDIASSSSSSSSKSLEGKVSDNVLTNKNPDLEKESSMYGNKRKMTPNTSSTIRNCSSKKTKIVEGEGINNGKDSLFVECNKSNNSSNPTETFHATEKESKSLLKLPFCMLCEQTFDLENYSDKSPLMSMSCFHSVCKECVLSSINKRRESLKRPNCNTCPCPIVLCKSPNAFNNRCLNWNLELFKFYELHCQK